MEATPAQGQTSIRIVLNPEILLRKTLAISLYETGGLDLRPNVSSWYDGGPKQMECRIDDKI